MPNRTENPEVVSHILGLYRLDKLCVKCGGPIEVENINTCNRCDYLLNLKAQLEMIETGVMGIRYKSGLGKTPYKKPEQTVPLAPKKQGKKRSKKKATK